MTFQTLFKSSKRVFYTIALLAGLSTLSAAPARATQLIDGMTGGIKAFRIEFNNKPIGRVVVVGSNNLNPPPGYTAGQEYWSWNSGAAWRGTFSLVPLAEVPNYQAFSWERFPHERFDLSRTVPMPAISPEANDRFYLVEVQKGTRWVSQGWMWLIGGAERKQDWYGVNLTTDLVGDGTAIRFTSATPPAAGSKDVYLLVR